VPLIRREDLVRERIGTGLLNLNPDVRDLPAALAVDVPLGSAPFPECRVGTKRLLVMGSVSTAGGGCACEANALLKAVLAQLILQQDTHLVVDLEAGVEHLGRGTAAHVDGLVVVSEPSRRSLETAADISRLALELGIPRQLLVLNRAPEHACVPDIPGLPGIVIRIPVLQTLVERQLDNASVLGLPETRVSDALIQAMLQEVGAV
jgi:CO dehydrogenase maturation factor